METRQAHSVILSMLLVRQRLVTIITYGFFARNVTTSNSFARFLRGREAVFPSNPVDERLSPFFLSHPRDIFTRFVGRRSIITPAPSKIGYCTRNLFTVLLTTRNPDPIRRLKRPAVFR